MDKVRKAGKAGAWYPADPKQLANVLNGMTQKADLPESVLPASPAGVMVPHAGLAFSGSTAGTAYAWIKYVLPDVETLILFGPSHRMGLAKPAVWDRGVWDTPLGSVEVDADLTGVLLEAGAVVDERPHYEDNAIELQLPFIKHLFPGARIAPVALSASHLAWKFGQEAEKRIEATGKRVVAVASSDLTHYGQMFGVMPAGRGRTALNWVRANDQRFLEKVTALALDEIVPTAERDSSACGAGAAAAVAGWAKQRGCRGGVVLRHTNSYEQRPEGIAEHIVGYGSVAFPVFQ